jgi:hypothetical protein
MGAMTFGRDETVRCLQDLPVVGPGGKAMCLAHKHTVHYFLAPIYLTDEGYVLKVKGADRYHPLSNEEITQMQGDGTLPTPLPKYSLSALDYLGGYFLWIMLAAAILLVRLANRGGRRQQIVLQELPISTEPPALKTEGDRYIAAQAALQLRPRERILYQAYGLSGDAEPGLINFGLKGYLAALTDERLVLVETRVSAFRPRLENRGTEAIDRAQIASASRAGRTVRLQLRDGTARAISVDLHTKHFSNQAVFLLDVPRLFPGKQAPPPTR